MLTRLNRWMIRCQGFVAGILATLVVGIPVVLFAQEAVAPVAEFSGLKASLMTVLFTALLAGAGIISRAVLKLINQAVESLNKFIVSKVENEFVESALLRLTGLAHTVTANTWQTGYKVLRTEAKQALTDGRITKAEFDEGKKKVKAAAIQTLRNITPPQVLKTILGINAGKRSAEDELLGVMIEGAVSSMKSEGAAIKATATVVKEIADGSAPSPKVS